MFNKTRNRLVLFNSITLFLLLNLLGAIMYMVTSGRLYTQVDQTLYEQIESLDTHRIEELLREGDAHLTRPISLMVWDDDLNLIKQTPAYFFSNGDDWDDLKKYTGPTKAFNVKVDNHSYRILNSHQPGATFQFIYDLGTEKSVLNSLLITILIVDIISILLSVVIGVFMAQRALVPIKKAWDKQQQFVSDASHELRTPLTVLQVQLDRLFRHPFHTIEKESQKISVMMDETKRMSRIVRGLTNPLLNDSYVSFHPS